MPCLLVHAGREFTTTVDVDMDVNEEHLKAQVGLAEREFMDARAHYLLKNSIVDIVVQVDPLVKAVHSGPKANPMER